MTDFTKMTGPQLVAAYNAMVDEAGSKDLKRVTKFESVSVGAQRCTNLRRTIDAHAASDIPENLRRFPSDNLPRPAPNPAYEQRLEKISISNEADKRWRNWVPTASCMTRPRKATFAKQVREEMAAAAKAAAQSVADAASSPKTALSSASRSKRADKVIRLLCAENPRREGTDAYKYFEAMKGSPTVGQYITKFDDHKKAAQWLWNTCKDGYAELLG